MNFKFDQQKNWEDLESYVSKTINDVYSHAVTKTQLMKYSMDLMKKNSSYLREKYFVNPKEQKDIYSGIILDLEYLISLSNNASVVELSKEKMPEAPLLSQWLEFKDGNSENTSYENLNISSEGNQVLKDWKEYSNYRKHVSLE